MLKFFRKARVNMIKDKKVSRYLAYAIGEIILVMVGILLALQVNNWNEKRKIKKTLNYTLRIISADLAIDTTAAAGVIEFYENNQENSKKVLLGKFTKDNYQNCLQCFNLVTIYQPFNIQTKGINLLKNIIDSESEQVDSLITDLSKFYSVFTPLLEKSNNRMENTVMDNFKVLQDKSWFIDMAQANFTPEVIDYFTSSEDYKKRVVSHGMLAAVNHLSLSKQYKNNAAKLLRQIEERLNYAE